MDNRSIAQLLYETADLLEISAGDPFRIRSYRRAAEAVESSTVQLSEIANDTRKLLAIPGIGKGMAANIQEIEKAGTLPLREELLTKYRPSMLELLKLRGTIFRQQFFAQRQCASLFDFLNIRGHAFPDTWNGEQLPGVISDFTELNRAGFYGFSSTTVGSNAERIAGTDFQQVGGLIKELRD